MQWLHRLCDIPIGLLNRSKKKSESTGSKGLGGTYINWLSNFAVAAVVKVFWDLRIDSTSMTIDHDHDFSGLFFLLFFLKRGRGRGLGRHSGRSEKAKIVLN